MGRFPDSHLVEDIDFQPNLPQEKIAAVKTIGIDSAMKIVMKFSHKFWPSEVHGVICAHSFLPELWFEEPSRVGVVTPQSRPLPKQPVSVTSSKNTVTVITTTTTINNTTGEVKSSAQVSIQPALTYLVAEFGLKMEARKLAWNSNIVGFACSKNAERISQMSKQQVIDSMLAQLDSMFANKAAFEMLAADPQAPTPSADQVWDEAISLEKPATSTFMDCIIYDWGKQPYIKGGYSYPSSGATREVREDLARPIDDKVFFAGEATNPTSYMTLHGAMESGEFAAQALLKALPYPVKKPVKLPVKSKL